MLTDFEFREVMEFAKADIVKIVACIGKSMNYQIPKYKRGVADRHVLLTDMRDVHEKCTRRDDRVTHVAIMTQSKYDLTLSFPLRWRENYGIYMSKT